MRNLEVKSFLPRALDRGIHFLLSFLFWTLIVLAGSNSIATHPIVTSWWYCSRKSFWDYQDMELASDMIKNFSKILGGTHQHGRNGLGHWNLVVDQVHGRLLILVFFGWKCKTLPYGSLLLRIFSMIP